MKFSQYFLESTFKKSKHLIHIVDVPMFSIYMHKDFVKPGGYMEKFVRDSIPQLKKLFGDAKSSIGKIGFPSMHANVVLKDLSQEKNRITGGGVGGYAHHSRKYMTVGLNHIMKFDDYSLNLIVHEWAHLWMMNNSKHFKKEIQRLFKDYSHNISPESVPKYNEMHAGRLNRHHITDLENYAQLINLHEKKILEDWTKILINAGIMYLNNDNYEEGHHFHSSAEEMQKDLKEYIVNGINSIITRYADMYPPRLKVEEFVDSALKIIIPNMETMKEEWKENRDELFDKFHNEDEWDRLYNNIWLSGQIKSISLMKFLKNATIVGKAHSSKNFEGEEEGPMRAFLAFVNKWPEEYGMSNEDELWATAVELFFKLNNTNKKKILNLMATNK